MGTHVGALGLTLVAYWYARTRAGNDTFSFGTGKVYALAGYTSGDLARDRRAVARGRRASSSSIDYDDGRRTTRRCRSPRSVSVVNIVSALLLGKRHHYGHARARTVTSTATSMITTTRSRSPLLHDERRHADEAGTLDFNLRAAYIHIMADAFTSVLAIGALVARQVGRPVVPRSDDGPRRRRA